MPWSPLKGPPGKAPNSHRKALNGKHVLYWCVSICWTFKISKLAGALSSVNHGEFFKIIILESKEQEQESLSVFTPFFHKECTCTAHLHHFTSNSAWGNKLCLRPRGYKHPYYIPPWSNFVLSVQISARKKQSLWWLLAHSVFRGFHCAGISKDWHNRTYLSGNNGKCSTRKFCSR